jgi:hypothetical protein
MIIDSCHSKTSEMHIRNINCNDLTLCQVKAFNFVDDDNPEGILAVMPLATDSKITVKR